MIKVTYLDHSGFLVELEDAYFLFDKKPDGTLCSIKRIMGHGTFFLQGENQ